MRSDFCCIESSIALTRQFVKFKMILCRQWTVNKDDVSFCLVFQRYLTMLRPPLSFMCKLSTGDITLLYDILYHLLLTVHSYIYHLMSRHLPVKAYFHGMHRCILVDVTFIFAFSNIPPINKSGTFGA